MDNNTLASDWASDPKSSVPGQGQEKSCPGKKEIPTPDGNCEIPGDIADSSPSPDELNSDGSASAFEGTEAITDAEAGRNNKRRELDNPSGISDY